MTRATASTEPQLITPLELLNRLHTAGATLALTTDGHLTLDAPAGTITPDVRAALQLHKLALVALLRGDPIIPRLPRELEALVRQAQNGQVERKPEGVADVNRYVLAWAAAWALQGDREHVLERLWDVWRENNESYDVVMVHPESDSRERINAHPLTLAGAEELADRQDAGDGLVHYEVVRSGPLAEAKAA